MPSLNALRSSLLLPLVNLGQKALEDFPLESILRTLFRNLVDELVQFLVRRRFVLFELTS